ncbi:MAG: serine/threonine protein phosphatase [Deltaproteobacteria bacterium]|nr:serine/threonine protein phosphatase [Deltaproteobacteria bacterium]
MNSERIFIVGDVHGCLDMLRRLMDKIDWRPNQDNLIFLGDYIDRGKESKGVIDYILDLKKESSRVQCIMGNHENILLDFLNTGEPRLLIINGGIPTLESYQAANDNEDDPLIPPEHVAFFKDLIPYIELEDYYVVHAGFRPGVPIEDQSLEDLIWIREPFIFSNHDFGKTVIFGHTPIAEPLMMDNKIGLDTGAVYGNRLTCLELPRMKFHSVEA